MINTITKIPAIACRMHRLLLLTTLLLALVVDSKAFLWRENATRALLLAVKEKANVTALMGPFGWKDPHHLRAPVHSTMVESSSPAREIETKALLELYSQLKGNEWDANSGWPERHFLRTSFLSGEDFFNVMTPLCTWYGVTCTDSTNNDSGVIDLDLSYNNLVGDIPSLLWQMPTLRKVNLSGNSINDIGLDGMDAPNSFKAPIEALILTENNLVNLSGIGKATSLKNLQVGSNKLQGTFPTELLALTSLEKLDLSSNVLAGPVPTTIRSLAGLRELLLNDNDFDGRLPTELGDLYNLER